MYRISDLLESPSLLKSEVEGELSSRGLISKDSVAVIGDSNYCFLYSGSNFYYESYFEAAESARINAERWEVMYRDWSSYTNYFGQRLVGIVIPNKASVIPSLYPLQLPFQKTPRFSHLLTRLDELIDLNTSKYLQPFCKYGYRLLDTHLTEYGNMLVFYELITNLGLDFDDCNHFASIRHVLNKGDLGAKFNHDVTERVARLYFSDNVPRFTWKALNKPQRHSGLIYQSECTNPPFDCSLLVFGNSFIDRPESWGIAPYLVRSFAKVIFVWEPAVFPEYLDHFQCDYVVWQTCERFLGRLPAKRPISAQYLASICSSHWLLSNMQTTIPKRLGATLPVDAEIFIDQHSIGFSPAKQELKLHNIVSHVQRLDSSELFAVGTDGNYFSLEPVKRFLLEKYVHTDLLASMQSSMSTTSLELYRLMPVAADCWEATFGIVLPVKYSKEPFQILCQGYAPYEVNLEYDVPFAYSHWFMPEDCVLRIRAKYKVPKPGKYLNFAFRYDSYSLSCASTLVRPLVNSISQDNLINIPPLDNIKRVGGSLSNANSYINNGRSAFVALVDLFSEHKCNLTAPDCRLLDWGVGCGRVARHFCDAYPGIELHGVDIDAGNIEWCSRSLPGSYSVVNTFPPTHFPDNFFGVIYSCSVLSHLTFDAAVSWLAELSRILSPSGVAFLSFNGTGNGVKHYSRRAEDLIRLFGGAHCSGDRCSDLDGFIDDHDYYRSSFASDETWRRIFSDYFVIVDIKHSLLSGHQSVACLRRK